MARIVLVKLESDVRRHLLAPPFGILYLASALEKSGFEVRLHHRRIGSKADLAGLVQDVLADDPLFVGFSTLSGPSLMPALAASRSIRRLSPAPIVWGGLHPTMLPEQVLAEPWVDIAVLGEGEETIVELARAAAKAQGGRMELAGIAGLAYKDAARVRINPLRPFIEDLDAYRPAWHLLNIETYLPKGRFFQTDGGSRLSSGRIASILTSRGCPWRCSYCYNVGVNRRTFRAHSIGYTLDLVKDLRERYAIEAVHIQDDHFFGDPMRARAIARGLGLPWSSSGRANEIVRWGDPVLAELRASGCTELQIGAESGSPRVLELMKKDIKPEEIVGAAVLCGRHGIRVLFSFMAGLPGETEADRRMTYDLMDRLEDMGGHVVVNGPAVYFPWPGTPLFDLSVEKGFRPPARTRDWSFLLWGTHQPRLPFAPRRLGLVEHYRRLSRRKETASLRIPYLAALLKKLAGCRWRRRAFRFPVDYYIPRWGLLLLRRFGGRGAAAVYDD